MSINIKALPIRTLMDETLEITVSNMKSYQTVTVVAITLNYEDGAAFYSSGEFQSDMTGFLDVNRSFSYRGTYVGIESMALFWSAIPAPGQREGLRLIKRVVDAPLNWHLFLIDGKCHDGCVEALVYYVRNGDDETNMMHSTEIGFSGCKVNILGKSMVQRYYCYPENVRQIQVRDGRLRGILFVPVHFESTKRPKLGIIDIYGGASFKNHRAALLAERGYVVFGLAYCGHDDLPPDVSVDVEYLVEAADFMLSQRFPEPISTTGLGIIGLCKGATLALEMAANHSKIKAVVAINAPCFNEIGQFRRLGSEENVAFSWDMSCPYLRISEEGVITEGHFDWFDQKSPEEKFKIGIAVEKVSSILFVYGGGDVSVGVRHLDYFVQRLKNCGRNNFRCLVYPNAGHIIDPPISPLCRSSYWPLFKNIFVWGGEARHHHHAQVDSWNRILSYFEYHLNTDLGQP